MNIIIMSTGELTLRIISRLKNSIKISIKGIVLDMSVDENYLNYFSTEVTKLDYKVYTLQEIKKLDFDFIFMCEYRKILDSNIINEYKILNLHAGILPKYRGFHANAWAILNGESRIGYSVHEVNEFFDGGPIFYIGAIKIKDYETYAQVRPIMLRHIEENIENILDDIFNGRYIGQIQNQTEALYCSKIKKEDGFLNTFDKTTENLYNLFRIMAKPAGTGIYFNFKERNIYVGKVIKGNIIGIQDYFGIPGCIVNITKNEGLWIKTQNNIICLSDLTDVKGNAVNLDLFKIGMRI